MIVCPVCENQQAQGDTCDVCGKRLVAAGVVAVPVTPMAELEGTRQPTAGAVAVALLPELEQTAQVKGADLPAQSLPELERTVLPGGPDAPVERVVDL